MPLSIKHPDADHLARKLAGLTGRSITDTVIFALREELRRRSGRRSRSGLADDLRAISAQCAALPERDARTSEEIIGFDQFGIPR